MSSGTRRRAIECAVVDTEHIRIGKESDDDRVLIKSNAGLLHWAVPVPSVVDMANAAAALTAAECLSGAALVDPNGGAQTLTLPTAALLVAAMDSPEVGDAFYLDIVNTANAAETITLAAGSGGTLTATLTTLAQNTTGRLLIRITDTDASPAYIAYRLG